MVLGLSFVHCWSLSQALTCAFCELTEATDCLECPIICQDEETCYTAKGMLLGVTVLQSKGCIGFPMCGRKETQTHFGNSYVLSYTCCQGKLCNGSPPQERLSPLILALVSAQLLGCM
uniref:UPAR/Ly6 domain-containing protein n=1 Tax=Xenopus tropicalis TaxID=8364 RepID=A0A6I8SSY1_XENTR